MKRQYRRHKNGGGRVAVTASVTEDVWLGHQVVVRGGVQISGKVHIEGSSIISGDATIQGDKITLKNCRVAANTAIHGECSLSDCILEVPGIEIFSANLKGLRVLKGPLLVRGNGQK